MNPATPYQVRPIVDAVAREFGVSSELLLSRDRHAFVTFVRQFLCYWLRYVTGLSTAEVGRAVGRDHVSVIFATRRAARWIDGHPREARDAVARIALALGRDPPFDLFGTADRVANHRAEPCPGATEI